MEMSQISTSVRDLWEFLWPPVLLLTTLFVVARFVASTSIADLSTATKKQMSAMDIGRLRARLRLWGLSKIVPIAVAFTIVFILYVARVTIFGAGSLLPPTVSYTPDSLIARRMDARDAACLWSIYGNVGLSQLPQIAERQGKFHSPERPRYWSDESGVYVQGLNAVKFVLTWCVVWSVVEIIRSKRRMRTLLRLALAVASIALVGFVVLGMYLYCVEQMVYEDIADIRSLLPQDGRCDTLRVSSFDEERFRRMSHERWWSLQVEPFRYGEWIIQNLIRGGA
jgi:hypothetical protein